MSSYFAVIILVTLTTVGGILIFKTITPNTEITNNIQTQSNNQIIIETQNVQNNTINLYIRNLGSRSQKIEEIYVNNHPANPEYTVQVQATGTEEDTLQPKTTTLVKIGSTYEPGKTYHIKIITDSNSIIQCSVKLPETIKPICSNSSNWWDTSYKHRKKIKIKTDTAIPDEYTVSITTKKTEINYLTTHNDLRIIYYHNSVYQELHRVIKEDNNNITITFKTVKPIQTDSQNQDYYLYYDNPSANNPPKNASKVYLWYDDFSTNTLERYHLLKSVDIHGGSNQYKLPEYDDVNQRISFDTGDNYASDMYPKGLIVDNVLISLDFWADKKYPTDATVALVSRMNNLGVGSTHYYYHVSHGRYSSPGGTYNSWSNSERNTLMYNPNTSTYWGFNDVHTLRYGLYGNRHILWMDNAIDEVPLADSTHEGYTGSGMVGWVPSQARGWMDNLIIRKYVLNEPVLSFFEEENCE